MRKALRRLLSSEDRLDDAAMLALLILLLSIALPTLNDYYLLNDADWVLRGKELWQDPAILWRKTEDGFIRTPVVLVFGLTYLLSKEQVVGYRLLLFFVHFANVCLGYVLLKRLSVARPARFCAMLFFAAHVSHYQTRFWIGTLPHVLALTFALLYFHCIASWLGQKGRAWFPAAYLCLVLAIFSRDYAALLPLALPLLFPRTLPKSCLYFLPAAALPFLLYPEVVYELAHTGAASSPLSLVAEVILRLGSLLEEWVQSSFLLSPAAGLETFQPYALPLMAPAVLLIFLALYRQRAVTLSARLAAVGVLAMIPLTVTFAADAGAFHRYRYYYLPAFFLACGFVTAATRSSQRLGVALFLGLSALQLQATLRYRDIFSAYSAVSLSTTHQILEAAGQENARVVYLLNPPASPSMVFASPVHLEGCLRLEHPGAWQVRFGLPERVPAGPFLALFFKEGELTSVPAQALAALIKKQESGP